MRSTNFTEKTLTSISDAKPCEITIIVHVGLNHVVMTNMENNMENNSPTPNARLIRIREAIQKTGLSKSTIYDLMASGRFPRSVRLSARCVAFVECEVDDWIASRIAARNNQQAA